MSRLANSDLFFLAVATSLASAACSEEYEQSDLIAMQAESLYGASSDWETEHVSWKDDLQKIRDKAYRYCLSEHPDDETCLDVQDLSIKTAVDVETAVQKVIEEPEKSYLLGIGAPLGKTIALEPERHTEAREHCFSIYRDAGASDARFLGPCLASTVSWDYFGFSRIP